MEIETKDIRRKYSSEFNEEERIHQAEQSLKETKMVMKGEHVPEPCEE